MSTATVTGKIGPAQTLTAKVFNNVSGFFVNPAAQMLELLITDNPQRIFIDITAVTTMTVTVVSASNYTITLS